MEEFSISEFIQYYFSKFLIVILFVLLGAVGSWYYTEKIQTPIYKSQTSLVLTRSNDSSTITQSDISLNKNLVSTYREIIKSRRILSKVIKNLDLSMNEKKLSEKITVSSANDTELIIISVIDEKPKVARQIADEIATVFQEEITIIYKIENISVVDTAIEATEPYNVHITKQYMIGIAGGFLIASILIITLFYFDDSIRSSEDIEKKMNLPVLATIPEYRKKKGK